MKKILAAALLTAMVTLSAVPAFAMDGCKSLAGQMITDGILDRAMRTVFENQCTTRMQVSWYPQCQNLCDVNFSGERRAGCREGCMKAFVSYIGN